MENRKLTDEEVKKLRKPFFKYLLRCAINATHHVLMLLLMSFIVHFAAIDFFDNPDVPETIGTVIIFIFIFRRMNLKLKVIRDTFYQEAKKIIPE